MNTKSTFQDLDHTNFVNEILISFVSNKELLTAGNELE